VEIGMSEIQDLGELKARISERGSQNLVSRITLKGLRDVEFLVNPEELETELGDRFFHLSIVDKSHPKTGELVEDEEHLIRSRFIKLMKSQIECSDGQDKDIADSALQYGIALLDGKDVL